MPASRRRSPDEHHTCIVVGAGVVGLAAACAITHRDVEVLVLEAGTPGHAESGSKGNARIFRVGYPDPQYVDMAVGALARWRLLENESGIDLLTTTGQLSFGPAVDGVAAALAQAGMEFERLSETEAARRFPGVRADGPTLFEPDSGVLAADACLRALHASGGFTIRSSTRVAALHDTGDAVEVTLDDGTLLSALVVINCAGPETLGLLGGPARPVARPATLQQVIYVSVDPDDPPRPVFIEWGPDMLYGLPVPGQPRYKVAQHLPGPTFVHNDADPDLDSDDADLVATLVAGVRRLLPGVDPHPVASERCLYDNSADTDFILDRVGRIVIGCGTSGHGFKFAPLLGELLADLATGMPPPIDLARFALSRSFLRLLPES